MRKKTLFAVMTVALCAIVAAGGLLASNMGFKLNYRLNANAATGGVGTGNNTLALPYFRQSGQNNAFDLMQDIGFTATAQVSKFNKGTNLFQAYTGRMGSTFLAPFALAAGEGYLVKMNPSNNVNYIIVGSHDPSQIITLDAPGANGNVAGNNMMAPPYNITATNALQLMQDIGFAATAGVSKFNKGTNLFQAYTGRMGSLLVAPFDLAAGEAYLVKMNPSNTVPYTPSHY